MIVKTSGVDISESVVTQGMVLAATASRQKYEQYMEEEGKKK